MEPSVVVNHLVMREKLVDSGPYVLVGFDTGATVPGMEDEIQAVISLAKARYIEQENHPEGVWVDYNSWEWAVLEDPEDGYRSTLRAIVPVPTPDGLICQFTRETGPVVYVKAIEHESFEGYQIVDLSGHVWAKIGTDFCDDYYPYCVCEWYPKAPP